MADGLRARCTLLQILLAEEARDQAEPAPVKPKGSLACFLDLPSDLPADRRRGARSQSAAIPRRPATSSRVRPSTVSAGLRRKTPQRSRPRTVRTRPGTTGGPRPTFVSHPRDRGTANVGLSSRSTTASSFGRGAGTEDDGEEEDSVLMSALRERLAEHSRLRQLQAQEEADAREAALAARQEARDEAERRRRQAIIDADLEFERNEKPDVFDAFDPQTQSPADLVPMLEQGAPKAVPSPRTGASRSDMISSFRERMAEGEDAAAVFLAACRQKPTKSRRASVLPGAGMLALGSYGVGDDLLAAMCVSVFGTLKLHSLDLSGNRLSARGVAALAEQLPLGGLRAVDLSRNPFGRLGCEELAAALRLESLPLRSLVLDDCKITDLGAKAIAEALHSNTRLYRLSMGGNEIGQGGGVALGALLGANTPLQELHLGWNRLFGTGAAALVESLRDNTNLHTLDLAWNCLGGACTSGRQPVHALGEALRRNIALRHLDLSHNRLGQAALLLLSRAVLSNWTLVGLHLRGNEGHVDAMGFVRPEPQASTQAADIYLEMASPRPAAAMPNGVGVEPLPSTLALPDDDCWVCGRWQEICISVRPPAFLMLKHGPRAVSPAPSEFSGSAASGGPVGAVIHFPPRFAAGPVAMRGHRGGEFDVHRVLPPGEVPFYITFGTELLLLDGYDTAPGWIGAPSTVNVVRVEPRASPLFSASNCIPRERETTSNTSPGRSRPTEFELGRSVYGGGAVAPWPPATDTLRALFEKDLEFLRTEVHLFARSEDARELLLTMRSQLAAALSLFRWYSLHEAQRELVVPCSRFVSFARDARLLDAGTQVTTEAVNLVYFAVKPEMGAPGLGRADWLLALARLAQVRYPGARLGPAYQRLLVKHGGRVLPPQRRLPHLQVKALFTQTVNDILQRAHTRLATLFGTFASIGGGRSAQLSLADYLRLMQPVLERELIPEGPVGDDDDDEGEGEEDLLLKRAFALSLGPDGHHSINLAQFMHALALTAALVAAPQAQLQAEEEEARATPSPGPQGGALLEEVVPVLGELVRALLTAAIIL